MFVQRHTGVLCDRGSDCEYFVAVERSVRKVFHMLMCCSVELGNFVGTQGSGWHNAPCCLVYLARLHHPRLCVLVNRHPGGTVPYQWAVAILNCFSTPLVGVGFQTYMCTV